MTVQVGDLAPDFELEGIEGDPPVAETFRLSAFRGAPVVLVFYPADGSPVCTIQLTTYTDDIAAFAEVGAQVLALSPQSVAAHTAFATSVGGFAFPLLADEDKAVAEAYGVLGPLGYYRRSVVVVDGDGRIAWAHRATAGLTFRPVAEIVDAVRRSTGG